MRTINIATAVAGAALVLAIQNASAQSFFEIEAGAGATYYTLTEGKWFQDGALDNHVVSHAPALMIGLTGNVIDRANWGVDWHADLNYFGGVSASCQCTISDADYNPSTHQVRKGATTESYYGSGHAMGVSLMLEPYLKYGGWKFGAAAGVLGYRKTWVENVSGWAGNFGDPRPVPVHLESAHGISFAPAVGLDVSYERFTFSYRYYFTSRNEGNTPPLWDDVQTMMVTYRF
ncbi:hypothetical protein AB4Y43_01460 [Paraburkholderia sp. BR10872]|uniref:hypothetical protein n=1 Tax=Paraburkholderia sp. BR10872 TaxID=3236989 RepID=UPI0034D176B9